MRLSLALAAVCVCWLVACDSDAGHDEAQDAGMPDAADDDDFHGCPEITTTFEPGLHTEGEHMVVELIAAMPEEPERHLNNWTVELSALDGSPAADAKVVRGQTFMPVHGHDGRVEPQMTPLSEPGQVEIDRLNFTMRGPWQVRLWLSSASLGDDYVEFAVCVAK